MRIFGLCNHKIKLKIEILIMLLRNLDQFQFTTNVTVLNYSYVFLYTILNIKLTLRYALICKVQVFFFKATEKVNFFNTTQILDVISLF